MNEGLMIWMSAGIVLFIGAVNITLTIYTWELLKGIRRLLESNVYLNTEAMDLIRYGRNRGYEQGREDALKRAAQEGANLE